MARRPTPLTPAAIAEVAIGLFAERGVEKTTMLSVATALGVTEPAIYRHYANKDDLFARTFLEGYARIAQGVAEAAEGRDTLADVARAVVAMFADLFDREKALFTFVLIDQHRGLPNVSPDPAVNPVVAIRRLLERIAGDHEAAELELAAAAAIGIVVQTAVFTHYGRLHGPLSARVDPMTAAVLAAIAAILSD